MLLTYSYKATVVRCIDGDSVVFDIDCGFDIQLKGQSTRLFGIDTAETRGGTDDLKALGNLAKNYVIQMLPEGSEVLLKTSLDKKGKFGRILAEVFMLETVGVDGYQDKSLNTLLLDELLAVPYHGQSKEDIINQHLINVEHHKGEGRI
jgi:endonuclease YncB( thermonuclease family)